MLSYSLKSPHEIEANVGGFFGSQEIMTDQRCVKAGNPEEDCLMRPIVYNYTAAFKEAPLVRYMLNGVFVTVHFYYSGDCGVALCLCTFKTQVLGTGCCIWHGNLLSSDTRARHRTAALYHAGQGWADQYLWGADHSMVYFGVWNLPDAAVFYDRAG